MCQTLAPKNDTRHACQIEGVSKVTHFWCVKFIVCQKWHTKRVSINFVTGKLLKQKHKHNVLVVELQCFTLSTSQQVNYMKQSRLVGFFLSCSILHVGFQPVVEKNILVTLAQNINIHKYSGTSTI